MLPPARQSRPAQNFPDQTASTNMSVPTSLGCTLTTPDPQAFLNRLMCPTHRGQLIVYETIADNPSEAGWSWDCVLVDLESVIRFTSG